ncbi:protein kinase superfamily protein isoform X2 [Tasmannia lanceolata]|uniref:protein kinase superfamily protein isoform X2 n=1 Tax=Tasmannia lanceolata TaxID=3420 RepID=UPI0040638B3C
MKLLLRIALGCIISILWFQSISCDELLEGPGMEKWTCLCASSNLGTQSYTPGANCSTACACRPEEAVDELNGEQWTCLCAEGVPATPGDMHNASCFTSCNCTSGAPGTSKAATKHISSKPVVYILLLCVLLTTVALLSSVSCYIYRRKDRCLVQTPVFSSDKDTSWNSGTNLISHRSGSVPEFQININSRFNPITGCMHKASFMFRSKRGTIPGTLIQFSYFELEQATNKFSSSNLIGVGSSSNVYHGELKNGRAVAVKRLKMRGGPDAELEFLTEIELISRLHHCHIVPLLGYCYEFQGKHDARLLVFEYMANGNLRDCLDGTQGKEPIEWGTRIGIALGAARGLEYLHEAAAPRILHRDVKSTNILLDEKWRAKITDLGMAKCLATDGLPSCSNSPARMLGTFGYFAPEYAIVGKASLKSDVFSFGVVLLELISGRQPICKGSKKGEESLVIWATPHLHDRKWVVSELADPLLKGDFPKEEMLIMAHLARECLQLDPEPRPTMSEIVQVLSTITPDKSRRGNFPINFFQSASCQSMKCVEDVENSYRPADNSEMRRAVSERWPNRCSLPLMVDRNLCMDGRTDADNTVLSGEYIERLILLTSRARSWRAHDEETVDITEPRLEKFWQSNVQSL